MSVRPESLATVLGGRRGALDASLPPVAFVLGWLVSGRSIGWGAAVAITVAVVVGVVRLLRGQRVAAVVISLAAVVAAALVALYTGRAQDFFLLQVLANVGSALAWAASILIRWPLLGVIVGVVLGQKTRWRRDPALLRAYSLASWVWFGQYVLRVAVFGVLWWGGQVVALGVARTVLSWPLVAAVIAVSGWVLHKALPREHPGFRHPATELAAPRPAESDRRSPR
ncbi:DUF3159 domain-containing protein [Thermocrispum municipale]|uniref:DUF3159 domain-containing protein n=1 Tax=Thermocrispum municipale TaxID=37926 RepID=UPI00048B1305|nr:DUF3159 domain-containing protein [Thermocrispum municipale]